MSISLNLKLFSLVNANITLIILISGQVLMRLWIDRPFTYGLGITLTMSNQSVVIAQYRLLVLRHM